MASFKSILIIALVSFGIVPFNPVMAQNPTRSTLDFWLTFGELLTEDFVDALSQITLPSLPSIPLPNIQFPPINIPIPVPSFPTFPVPIPIPGFACSGTPGTAAAATTTAAPAVTPTAPTSPQQQQLSIYLYYLYQLYPSLFAQAPPSPSQPIQPTQPTAAPLPPAPVTASPPAVCDGCKPDKVRIVVVEDCDEKKSSESCEDSDEVVVAPRGRFNRKFSPNGF